MPEPADLGERAVEPRRRAIVGYTTGIFDLFNARDLHLLREARERCDHLIVGVATDELVEELAGVRPAVSFLERMTIVQSLRHVDTVVPRGSVDDLEAWYVLKYDVLFLSPLLADDHKVAIEQALAEVGVAVVHLPSASPPHDVPRRSMRNDVVDGVT